MESKYKKKDIKHKFDNMSRLGYEITGKRGGTPQVKDDIGCVGVFIDNPMGCQYSGGDSIMVDAFKGRGETYGRREKCNITIRKSGKYIFEGSFDELISKLTTDEKTYEIEPIED